MGLGIWGEVVEESFSGGGRLGIVIWMRGIANLAVGGVG